MPERVVWLLKWGGLAIASAAVVGVIVANANGDPIGPWVGPLVVGVLMLGVGWYVEGPRQETPRGVTGRWASVPGYDSLVVDVRESPVYRGRNVVDLRLYTPGDKPSERAVSCRVIHGVSVWSSKDTFPRWQDRHLEEGDREHYHAFLMPACFAGVPEKLEDGVYKVVWSEEYGLGSRQLTKPHRFRIRQGLVVIPGERLALVKKLRDLGE